MTTTARGRETTRLAIAAKVARVNRGAFPEVYREAMAALVRACRKLAVYQAARFLPMPGVDADDLYQSAMLKLDAAVAQFDPARGLQFATYVVRMFLSETSNRYHDQRATIRIPRYLYQQKRAEGLVRYTRLREDKRGWVGDMSGWASIADRAPEPAPDWLDRADELPALLAALTDRERDVIARRFGLDGRTPETLAAIGRSHGVCKERARQIEEEAIARLRAMTRREVA